MTLHRYAMIATGMGSDAENIHAARIFAKGPPRITIKIAKPTGSDAQPEDTMSYMRQKLLAKLEKVEVGAVDMQITRVCKSARKSAGSGDGAQLPKEGGPDLRPRPEPPVPKSTPPDPSNREPDGRQPKKKASQKTVHFAAKGPVPRDLKGVGIVALRKRSDAELRAMCKERELEHRGGDKRDLVQRLLNFKKSLREYSSTSESSRESSESEDCSVESADKPAAKKRTTAPSKRQQCELALQDLQKQQKLLQEQEARMLDFLQGGRQSADESLASPGAVMLPTIDKQHATPRSVGSVGAPPQTAVLPARGKRARPGQHDEEDELELSTPHDLQALKRSRTQLHALLAMETDSNMIGPLNAQLAGLQCDIARAEDDLRRGRYRAARALLKY